MYVFIGGGGGGGGDSLQGTIVRGGGVVNMIRCLILSKTYTFNIFFTNNYSIPIKGQLEHSGLCPVIRAVFLYTNCKTQF